VLSWGVPPIPPPPPSRVQCLRCRRPESVCLCGVITPIPTVTRFVFLMHPKEARRIKNGTGRIAHLSLPESELVVGVDFRGHARVRALLADPSLRCQLLYPRRDESADGGAIGAPVGPHGRLQPVVFVLDATWPFAKKMMRLSTNLHALPRLSLTVDRPSEFVIKHQPHPSCLATIEAVDRVLHALAAQGVERYGARESDALLRPFREMNAMAIEAAADPARPSYRNSGTFKEPGARIPRRTPPRGGRRLLYEG
jgi:DTW domain-containing protein YfiP